MNATWWKYSAALQLVIAFTAQAASPVTVGQSGGTGASPAAAESRSELPLHTIYRPQRWPTSAVPLYVWGNGGCSANGLSHAAYLREIASQGYLVVALGTPDGGQPAPPPPAATSAAEGPPQRSVDPTTPAQMLEAIDWATKENARKGSEFSNRIDLTRIAVGGHSCGGLQALAVSNDPRIRTTLVLDSGIYIRPGGRSGVQIDKSQLERLHGPMLYLTGGPQDIAHENALDDFARLERVPVFLGSMAVGHGGTFSAPNGGDWARVSLRWLNWNLKGDAEAGLDFSGSQCRLCTDAKWTVQQKRLPAADGPRRQSPP